MIQDVRRIRKELDSIITAFRSTSKYIFSDDALSERIQELVISWLSVVDPGLKALGVPGEVLTRAKNSFSALSRLTSHRSRRQEYLSALSLVRSVIADQILLEVAARSQQIIVPSFPTPEALIPEIPGLSNQLIPNSLLGWLPQMKDFLSKNAYDRNVFVMVSYRARLRSLIEHIKSTLVELELNPVVARDHIVTDDLNNPIACLLCCNYGVAIFDRPEPTQRHNPNVVYELGMMQLLKKPCLILKHQSLRRMPTDILSRLYEDYQTTDHATHKLRAWWQKLKAP